MYTYNDLVAALQSGVSVEDLAAQMSKDLNAAKEEYDRLAAEKAAAKLKAATEARKRELMINFYMALGEYLTEFHSNSLIAEMFTENGTPSDEDLDELAEQVDGLVEAVEAMKGLTALLGEGIMDPVGKINKIDKPVNKTIEVDPIEAFLNKNVRNR